MALGHVALAGVGLALLTGAAPIPIAVAACVAGAVVVEILRQPLIGDPIVWRYWLVVLAITVVGWAVSLLALRNYRSRVAYWV